MANNNIELAQVFQLVVTENTTEAESLLHDWFVQKFKQVNEALMENIDEAIDPDSLSEDDGSLDANQEQGQAEEFYDDDTLSNDDDGEVEVSSSEEEIPVGDDDLDGMSSVQDLAAELTRIAAEFNALASGETAADMAGDDLDGGEVAPVDGVDLGDEDELEGDELGAEAVPTDESADDFDFSDLDESVELTPVKSGVKANTEIGSEGKKVNGNDKSNLPSHKPDERLGGKPVEVRSTQHKGYDMETPPKWVQRGLLTNEQKKDSDNLEPVSKEGDKSALLNSKQGFGSDSPKSPIGGGNSDLRGKDLRRK